MEACAVNVKQSMTLYTRVRALDVGLSSLRDSVTLWSANGR